MTGLRRRELGSLTPRSFDLVGDPPTLTVEAANSKHRKKDVLPLHPEAVELVREWVKGLEPCDKLFPQLDRRKTWLMVKKDLERVGIPLCERRRDRRLPRGWPAHAHHRTAA
jgi:integrase